MMANTILLRLLGMLLVWTGIVLVNMAFALRRN